jgi:hypothetical protein
MQGNLPCIKLCTTQNRFVQLAVFVSKPCCIPEEELFLWVDGPNGLQDSKSLTKKCVTFKDPFISQGLN